MYLNKSPLIFCNLNTQNNVKFPFLCYFEIYVNFQKNHCKMGYWQILKVNTTQNTQLISYPCLKMFFLSRIISCCLQCFFTNESRRIIKIQRKYIMCCAGNVGECMALRLNVYKINTSEIIT